LPDLDIIKGLKSGKDNMLNVDTLPKYFREGNMINLNAIIGLLIGAVKQLVNRVEELERRLEK